MAEYPVEIRSHHEPASTEKTYISAQSLLEDSFRLGVQVLDSGFRPSFIVGVWRGGTPVGIAVQELLDFFGVETDHIAIRTSLYRSIGRPGSRIRVHGMQYVIDHVEADQSLLIVDDVFDTGLSIDAVISHLPAPGAPQCAPRHARRHRLLQTGQQPHRRARPTTTSTRRNAGWSSPMSFTA